MQDMFIIIAILLAHFAADFFMQTDNMAKNKSTSIRWLSQHVLVYMLTITVLMGFFYTTVPYLFISFVLINGAAHWCVDFVTSKITKKLHEAGKIHEFFVVIGFDQFLHYVILFVSYAKIFNV